MKKLARYLLAVFAIVGMAAGLAQFFPSSYIRLGDGVQASQGSVCVPTTGTVSGLTFAQNINTAFDALQSMNSGAASPTNNCSGAPALGMLWLDTVNSLLKVYDGSTTWVTVGKVDATNHIWVPPVGGGSGSITAAATTDLCATANKESFLTVAGATGITSFGSSCTTGQVKYLTFSAGPAITYNAASMILPTGASVTVAANYNLAAVYLGASNWRVLWITKADGTALATTGLLATSGGTMTGAFIEAVSVLTDGATPALNAALGNVFTLTAAGDRTIAVPTNAVSGQKIVIRHLASGADRTLSLNTGAGGFRFGTTITALTITTSAKTDYIGAIYNAADSKWDVVAYAKGF